MGEYIRDSEEHQIYRDFANRLGKLAAQYQVLNRNLNGQENYGATLTLSLLHPLLTIYAEIRNRNPRLQFDEFDRPLRDIPDSYGIRLIMVKLFTCFDKFARREDVTLDFVLESIRHALSHPCPILDEQHQRTGYETVVGQNSIIEKFRFIQSSDVFGGNGRPKNYRKDEAERILFNISALNHNHAIALQPVSSRYPNATPSYILVDTAGVRFVRKIVIEIPLDTLKTLVKDLSKYLGRPITEMVTQQFNGPRLAKARR